ncbi:hypothetical protein HOC13_03735 [Candidatus Woesearchaeota archaeon]|jgi:hypothetical protein|nr:hypothetical protein [Candidatus Woesearchaeota archaeon]
MTELSNYLTGGEEWLVKPNPKGLLEVKLWKMPEYTAEADFLVYDPEEAFKLREILQGDNVDSVVGIETNRLSEDNLPQLTAYTDKISDLEDVPDFMAVVNELKGNYKGSPKGSVRMFVCANPVQLKSAYEDRGIAIVPWEEVEKREAYRDNLIHALVERDMDYLQNSIAAELPTDMKKHAGKFAQILMDRYEIPCWN